MAGNLIWGNPQAQAVQRIFDELYEQTKGERDYKAFLDKCVQLGFLLTIPPDGDKVDVAVSINICDLVWRKLARETLVKSTKVMAEIDDKARKDLPDWRAALSAKPVK